MKIAVLILFMKRGFFTFAIASSLLLANSIKATPVYIDPLGNNNSSAALSLQSTIDARGNTLINVYNDQLDPNATAYWNGSGTTYTITVLQALAGSAAINTLGIYNMANPSQTMQIFSGEDSGDVATFTSPWTSFGFVLYNGYYGNTLYSDPNLNGGDVNMVTYSGTGETLLLGDNLSSPIGTVVLAPQDYLMSWEDTAFSNPNCDYDYNDLTVVLSAQVPDESYTAALLLVAMIGVFLLRGVLSKQPEKA